MVREFHSTFCGQCEGNPGHGNPQIAATRSVGKPREPLAHSLRCNATCPRPFAARVYPGNHPWLMCPFNLKRPTKRIQPVRDRPIVISAPPTIPNTPTTCPGGGALGLRQLPPARGAAPAAGGRRSADCGGCVSGGAVSGWQRVAVWMGR